jgi:hypothetical protein
MSNLFKKTQELNFIWKIIHTVMKAEGLVRGSKEINSQKYNYFKVICMQLFLLNSFEKIFSVVYPHILL